MLAIFLRQNPRFFCRTDQRTMPGMGRDTRDWTARLDAVNFRCEVCKHAWEAVPDLIEECAKVCDARYMGDNNREDQEAKRCAADVRTLKKKKLL